MENSEVFLQITNVLYVQQVEVPTYLPQKALSTANPASLILANLTAWTFLTQATNHCPTTVISQTCATNGFAKYAVPSNYNNTTNTLLLPVRMTGGSVQCTRLRSPTTPLNSSDPSSFSRSLPATGVLCILYLPNVNTVLPQEPQTPKPLNDLVNLVAPANNDHRPAWQSVQQN